jgi:DNA-binding Lrp family transcriptional regulator
LGAGDAAAAIEADKATDTSAAAIVRTIARTPNSHASAELITGGSTGRRESRARDAKIWQERLMLDKFDFALLNAAQRDSSQTAQQLAEQVPLSPSAIARRLRRLRAEGWIERTISLLSPRLHARRLRAVVLIQLSEHADLAGKAGLHKRILAAEQAQFCYEITGTFDLLALFECDGMDEFNRVAEATLSADATVRRYETSFVKRDMKFAPFVKLGPMDVA